MQVAGGCTMSRSGVESFQLAAHEAAAARRNLDLAFAYPLDPITDDSEVPDV